MMEPTEIKEEPKKIQVNFSYEVNRLAENNLLDVYEKLFTKSKCKDIVKKLTLVLLISNILNVQKGKLK